MTNSQKYYALNQLGIYSNTQHTGVVGRIESIEITQHEIEIVLNTFGDYSIIVNFPKLNMGKTNSEGIIGFSEAHLLSEGDIISVSGWPHGLTNNRFNGYDLKLILKVVD